MSANQKTKLAVQITQLYSRRFYVVLVSFFAMIGIVYVGNAWSPSSYAVVLKNTIQAEDIGLVAGTPRCIRSDEYAALTPLTQATVNNRFDRYNETSFYREDLRMMFSLPILDWGMLFKPTTWLYPLVNPAYAFSFHHFMLMFLFIFGYTRLIGTFLGGSHLNALCFSFILFFTGFTQHWWTVVGPVLAFFPWLMISLELKVSLWVRMAILYWVATCWIFSFFYPPVIITLAFVALLILLAFHPELFRMRSMVGFGVASIASVVTVGFYLKEYIAETLSTVYPGQRVSMGGGVGLNFLMSQFFPTSQIHRGESLIGLNICEIGTIGTFYFLVVLCFLNYSGRKDTGVPYETSRALLILGIGVLAMYAWMMLPLPSWVGMPLLWNRVPPQRMLYAAGFGLLLIAFVCARSFGFRLTWRRFAVFAAITVAGWYHYKWGRFGLGLSASWRDVIVLLPVGAAVLSSRLISERHINTVMLGISVVMGALTFGTFNPVQSAWPIFNRPETSVTKMLDRLSATDPHGTLAIASTPESRFGAVLNGWGYQSVSHILVTPRLGIWREKFPDMPAHDRDTLFNRYAHIILTTDDQPRLLWADAVAVPITAFRLNGQSIVLSPPC